MKKLLLLFIIPLFLLGFVGQAQIVYETNYKPEASNGLWYYTNYKPEADIIIYKTTYKPEANY